MNTDMKAGEELDCRIAEEVMGWKLHTKNGYKSWWEYHQIGRTKVALAHKWNPSTSISDAWKVVEKMKESGWRFSLVDYSNRYQANFSMGDGFEWRNNREHLNVPLLICEAALAALSPQAARKEV